MIEPDGADQIRAAYLDAAATAAALLQEPAVAASWDQPSALAKQSVGGLAAHLGRQVLRVAEVLAGVSPSEQPVPLLEHYARSTWVEASIDDAANADIRRRDEHEAAAGPAAVLTAVENALHAVRAALPAAPANRVVHVPWGGWALSLDDFLVTRLVEITVHGDDLAVSVGIEPPSFPAAVLDPVLVLLCQLAVRRHGPTAVLRALSRAERAPATISAF